MDPSGYSFWSKFFGIIIGVAVAVMTGNPYLGYEYYRAVDREISESQSTGEAITRTYAVVLAMGAASGPSDSGLNPLAGDPKQQAANARQAGELTHSALDSAYGTHAEATAQALVRDLGVSAGRAADAVAEALATPNTLAQVAQHGQGGAQLLGRQGLTNQLAQRLTPNDEQSSGGNNQRLRAGLLTALSLGVEYAAEKLPPGTARGIVKVAGAGFAIHGAYEAGAAGLSSVVFGIMGPTPPFPPHVRVSAIIGGAFFLGVSYYNILRAQHLFTSGLEELYP
ncbi:MAG: hypothetical protein Q8R91_04395 [Candidatus Omnitrophota bacterium]|nr:hypothetical protein [Candidatus Omnitrophota bacterium]